MIKMYKDPSFKYYRKKQYILENVCVKLKNICLLSIKERVFYKNGAEHLEVIGQMKI